MSIVVTQSGMSSVNGLGFTAVAGRLLIAVVGVRSSGTLTGASGWTVLTQADCGQVVAILYKVAAGGETTVGYTGIPFSDYCAVSIEVSGAAGSPAPSGSSLTAGGSGGGTNFDLCPAITPTNGAGCIVIGGVASVGFDSLYTVASAGFTLAGSITSGAGDNPVIGLVYSIVTASGSYTPGMRTRNQTHAASTGVFYASAGAGGSSPRSWAAMIG